MAPTETEQSNISSTSVLPAPHIVLVPFVEQGQTIPMVDLSRLLAKRGARVSLVTTPFNAARLQGVADRARLANLAIDIVELPFPPAYDGVPSSCDNIDNFLPLLMALHLLAGPMEVYLRALEQLPLCIICDVANSWMAGVARSVGVPRLFFHGPSCFYSLCDLKVATHGLKDDGGDSYVVPEMPVRVEVTKATSSSAFLTTMPAWKKFWEGAVEAMLTADGAVVNTFLDLEGQFVSLYEAALGMPVWALGPFCLSARDAESMASRSSGDEPSAVDNSTVTAWLDTMGDPGSVIYVSFGSITRKPPKQLYEVGHGLESSGKPFLWVIKESELAACSHQWLLDLEARTAGRGLVVRGWAPQLTILAHAAVGGFVTHCGWNSMLEALAHGVPVVTWPSFVDQFLNERLAVDVLGVGVPVTSFRDEAVPVVTRGDVARAVSELMGDGAAAQERRRKAKMYGDRAHRAMEKGGSSYENLTTLVQSFTLNTSTTSSAKKPQEN